MRCYIYRGGLLHPERLFEVCSLRCRLRSEAIQIASGPRAVHAVVVKFLLILNSGFNEKVKEKNTGNVPLEKTIQHQSSNRSCGRYLDTQYVNLDSF